MKLNVMQVQGRCTAACAYALHARTAACAYALHACTAACAYAHAQQFTKAGGRK